MNIDANRNFHFYNTLCSERVFYDLFVNHKVINSNASQNFFKLFAEGINSQPNTSVFVNSLLPINTKDQRRKFWKREKDIEDGILYITIPLINLPFLRLLIVVIFVFFEILFTKRRNSTRDFIVVDFLRFSLNVAVILASKIRGFKTIAVVTDMPGMWITKNNLFEKIRYNFKSIFKYDYYIFVSEQSNKVLNYKNRPYVVLESFVNHRYKDMSNNLESKYNERVLIYAGGLYKEYGLENLIEAFLKITDKNLQLWFFGSGPFVNHIEKYSRKDSRICYKGLVLNEDLAEILTKATLLINPRPTFGEYTKYSFPSKNLEFMSTGTPLITTRLESIPQDHFPHLFFFDDDSVEGLYFGLNNVLKLDRHELHAFGIRAKDFVVNEKNNIVQAGKLIKIL